MFRFFKELFQFTKGERQGISVLLLLILLLLGINIYLPFYFQQQDSDFSKYAKEIKQFQQQQGNAKSTYSSKQNANSINENYLINQEEKTTATDSTYKPTYEKNKYTKPAYKKLYINLNTADTTELMQLRGIGSTFAKRIIKYRDMLGGFYTTEQLLEVYGFNTEKFELVKDEVYVKPEEITTIPFNSATVKELNKHVYIDYKLANAIVKQRFKKQFTKAEDLKEVYLVNDSILRKLAPYFSAR